MSMVITTSIAPHFRQIILGCWTAFLLWRQSNAWLVRRGRFGILLPNTRMLYSYCIILEAIAAFIALDGVNIALVKDRTNLHVMRLTILGLKWIPLWWSGCSHCRIFVWGTMSSVLLKKGMNLGESDQSNGQFWGSVWAINILSISLPVIIAIIETAVFIASSIAFYNASRGLSNVMQDLAELIPTFQANASIKTMETLTTALRQLDKSTRLRDQARTHFISGYRIWAFITILLNVVFTPFAVVQVRFLQKAIKMSKAEPALKSDFRNKIEAYSPRVSGASYSSGKPILIPNPTNSNRKPDHTAQFRSIILMIILIYMTTMFYAIITFFIVISPVTSANRDVFLIICLLSGDSVGAVLGNVIIIPFFVQAWRVSPVENKSKPETSSKSLKGLSELNTLV
ncbi:uncharacterized protein MELLADRAFT_102710 [Melampsora larici-populina 98AG31]|uniref:Uncharacterized protein n=1 Tax=Melampsora larici-populina (strain 98AG31 / pathotype 3-4-7) TaxID=747676 RepID=F4R951_MELLP|nr:uncharacterized protein MELLADRAFT_102710 [Melampsora larici-populina 98AG31]EGG10924.1 hypothetical protein MELLADRAFT_102710 [Melampsora larici-populina 98AG31]